MTTNPRFVGRLLSVAFESMECRPRTLIRWMIGVACGPVAVGCWVLLAGLGG